jgi:hypothetical protein
MSCVLVVRKTYNRLMSNETPQSKRYLYSILLLSVQRISTLITSHHQALIKIHEETTLIYNTWLINRLRSEAHSVYRCVYQLKSEIVSHKSQYILKCTKNVAAVLILCVSNASNAGFAEVTLWRQCRAPALTTDQQELIMTSEIYDCSFWYPLYVHHSEI